MNENRNPCVELFLPNWNYMDNYSRNSDGSLSYDPPAVWRDSVSSGAYYYAGSDNTISYDSIKWIHGNDEIENKNKDMDLTFLSNVVVKEVPSRRLPGEKNPTNGADLRLFADGSIYPSEALVAEFDLEYQVENKGKGFDVIDSDKWGSYPENAPRVMFISPVDKTEMRVDLFGSTKFNEDGTPKASVVTQGSSSYGAEMIQMLKEVYNVEVTDFVDLCIQRNATLPASKSKVYKIPKRKTRNNGGEIKYLTTRRENATFYALTPYEMTESNTESDSAEQVVHEEESINS